MDVFAQVVTPILEKLEDRDDYSRVAALIDAAILFGAIAALTGTNGFQGVSVETMRAMYNAKVGGN